MKNQEATDEDQQKNAEELEKKRNEALADAGLDSGEL